MRRNIIETVMGAVVVAVAAIFVTIAFQSSGLESRNGYEVTARFSDATGLATGTDVRLAGVKVGTVVGQQLDPQTFEALVTLSIEEAVQLPQDTAARIVPEGLLGSNFVALEPGGAEETIPAGGAISYTQGAVNVVDLLGRFIFSTTNGAPDTAAPPQ